MAKIKHDRLTLGELLSNDRRAVVVRSCQLGLRNASIRGVERSGWGVGSGFKRWSGEGEGVEAMLG